MKKIIAISTMFLIIIPIACAGPKVSEYDRSMREAEEIHSKGVQTHTICTSAYSQLSNVYEKAIYLYPGRREDLYWRIMRLSCSCQDYTVCKKYSLLIVAIDDHEDEPILNLLNIALIQGNNSQAKHWVDKYLSHFNLGAYVTSGKYELIKPYIDLQKALEKDLSKKYDPIPL